MKKLTCLLAFLLCGCFFSTPQSRFYLLENGGGQAVSDKKMVIAVQDILVPEYLDRPQIVLQYADKTELKISEFDRWATSLNTLLQTGLINNLSGYFPQATVIPLVYGVNAKYVVQTDVETFSGDLNADAYFSGSWKIMNANGRVLKENKFSFSSKTGNSYDAYVKTQSVLLKELAQEIAENIQKL